jgi:3-deoxy-manno-octulosonate cytidylyltransferase (CMP-KDO synthetase)
MEPLTFGIIIPARYASTRFPGKPLSLIAGKPMIVRTVEAAIACNPTAGVAVATDDERIAEAVAHLVPVVMTRSDHQTGTDRIAEAYEKLQWDCDIVVNLQGDEPFITPTQVKDLVACFQTQSTDIATLKKKMGPLEELNNPNLVKVITDKAGFALYFSRSVIPYNRGNTNIDYYRHIGMYAYRGKLLKRLSLLKNTILEETEMLEQLRWLDFGYVIKVTETDYEGPAVDTPDDLRIAESFYLNSDR